MPFIGYGCCFDTVNTDDAKAILKELEDLARQEDCLTMSISTHPLQTLDINKVWDAPYAIKNYCQMLDVTEHPFNMMSSKRRNAFRNETQYVKKRSSFFIDNDPDRACFDKWYKVYLKLSEEQNSVPQRKDLFEKYWKMPRTDIDFWVLRNDQEVAGGIFFAKGKGITDYNTSAFDSKFKELCCTTHVLDAYFSNMAKNGGRFFNMQSSKKFQDGTYRYKERWGAELRWHDIVSKNLVDLQSITCIPLETIKNELPGCFVLPYSLWDPREKGKGATMRGEKE
jgi:hypothetical protein